MHLHTSLLAAAIAVAGTALVGCGSAVDVNDDAAGAGSGVGGGGGATTASASSSSSNSTTTSSSATGQAGSGPSSGSGGAATESSVSVRIAQLSPFLPDAPDVCIGSDVDGFVGPIVASALALTLTYGDVSAYVPAAAKSGAEARVVRAGAGCGIDAMIAPSALLPDLQDGDHLTLVLQGVIGEGYFTQAGAFEDDVDGDPTLTPRVRVINATTDWMPIDVRANLCSELSNPLLFSTVPFGSFGTTSPLGSVSASGFLTTPMGCFGPLHVTESTADLSFDATTSLFTSGAMSVFVAGSFYEGSITPARAITCFDSVPGSGPLSNCYAM